MQKVKTQEYKNINSEIDEKEMYELDKFSINDSHKELYNHVFEIKLETFYHMKSFNDMNHIHDNKVNNIAQ